MPSRLHFQVARDFIDAGIDVLVEKPLTANIAEARELVQLAQAKNVILQVGHLERLPGHYLICTPEIARLITSRWISDVPSKIVQILASRCIRSTGNSRE